MKITIKTNKNNKKQYIKDATLTTTTTTDDDTDKHDRTNNDNDAEKTTTATRTRCPKQNTCASAKRSNGTHSVAIAKPEQHNVKHYAIMAAPTPCRPFAGSLPQDSSLAI